MKNILFAAFILSIGILILVSSNNANKADTATTEQSNTKLLKTTEVFTVDHISLETAYVGYNGSNANSGVYFTSNDLESQYGQLQIGDKVKVTFDVNGDLLIVEKLN